MKKVITSALISAAMVAGATAAHADAGDWFVGLEAGKARNSMELKAVPSDKDNQTLAGSSSKVKSTSYGIRVGKYINAGQLHQSDDLRETAL